MKLSTNTAVCFCGHPVPTKHLEIIGQTIEQFPKLTRTELANTICELLDWTRPTGKLKTVECRQFLEALECSGRFKLPERVHTRSNKSSIAKRSKTSADEALKGKLADFQPVSLSLVQSKEARNRWREMIESYHYLGYRIPFGAHLRYFIYVSTPEQRLAGCLQFSSPAWRMAARDQWIGWSDEARKQHLQLIINNSRFLLFPWVSIKYLASHTMALVTRRVADDWMSLYHTQPVLLETLVDEHRFTGRCYRASNWIEVGRTTGRGRQDTAHQRHNESPKQIFVYPLCKDARKLLGNHK